MQQSCGSFSWALPRPPPARAAVLLPNRLARWLDCLHVATWAMSRLVHPSKHPVGAFERGWLVSSPWILTQDQANYVCFQCLPKEHHLGFGITMITPYFHVFPILIRNHTKWAQHLKWSEFPCGWYLCVVLLVSRFPTLQNTSRRFAPAPAPSVPAPWCTHLRFGHAGKTTFRIENPWAMFDVECGPWLICDCFWLVFACWFIFVPSGFHSWCSGYLVV